MSSVLPEEPMYGKVFLYHLVDEDALPKTLAEMPNADYIYSGIAVALEELDSFCDVVKLFLPQKFAGRNHLQHGDIVQVSPNEFEDSHFLLVELEKAKSLIDGMGGKDLLPVPTHGKLYYIRMPEGFEVHEIKPRRG